MSAKFPRGGAGPFLARSLIDCVLANSTDPDETPYYAVFHLGLHCLSKVFKEIKGA